MKRNKLKKTLERKSKDNTLSLFMSRIYARIKNKVLYAVVMGTKTNWEIISDWIVDDEHDKNISAYMRRFEKNLDQARFFPTDETSLLPPILIPVEHIKLGMWINICGKFINLSDKPQTNHNYVCVSHGTMSDSMTNLELQEYKLLCKYKNLDPDIHVRYINVGQGYSIWVSKEYLKTKVADNCPL